MSVVIAQPQVISADVAPEVVHRPSNVVVYRVNVLLPVLTDLKLELRDLNSSPLRLVAHIP